MLSIDRLPRNGEEDNSLETWDLEQRKRVGLPRKIGKYPSNLAYRKDGSLVVCFAEKSYYGSSGELTVLDATTGNYLQEKIHIEGDFYTGGIDKMLGQQGQILATKANDRTWNLRNVDNLGNIEQTISLDYGRLERAELDEKTGLFITLCGNGRIALWRLDSANSEVVKTTTPQLVAMHPDGTQIAVAFENSIRVRSDQTGLSQASLFAFQDEAVALGYYITGNRLALATAKTVTIWDGLQNSYSTISLEQPVHPAVGYAEGYPNCAAFSQDLKLLAVGYGRYGAPLSGAFVWTLPSGKLCFPPLDLREGTYKAGSSILLLALMALRWLLYTAQKRTMELWLGT